MSLRPWFVAMLLVVCSSFSAHAEKLPQPRDQKLFQAAVSALARGAPSEAIDQFELLADHGVVHPDISYDRALAYIERARSPHAQPGDLGRAVAALSEDLALRPGDEAAKILLGRVRSELSRARSRSGTTSLLARPSLQRAIVGLLPENIWAGLALFFSLSTTAGLLLRLLASSARRRFVGATLAWLGLGLGITFAGMTALSARQRTRTRDAIVVVPAARLLDASGAALSGKPLQGADSSIPEGSRLAVLGQVQGLYRVEWGQVTAYLPMTELQLLPKR